MAQIIVIGTNLVGLASAFRLARGGNHTVLVLDPTQGARFRPDDGLVAPQTDCMLHPQGPSLSLLLQARDTLRNFTLDIMGASGIPIPWQTEGVMVLSDDEVETRTITDKALAHSRQGLRAFVANPLSMMELEPQISRSLMGGAFLPDDSAIDPRHYATALEMGIREYGGEIRRDITIEGLHEVGGHIRGVRTSDTTLGADHVILCDGEKNHDILASCGVHIPMTYGQKTMVRLRRDEKGPRHILCTSRLSIIPSAAHLLVTRPVQHEVLGNDPLLGDLHALSVDTTKVIADLQKSPAEEVVAWTTAVTADGTPYVGRLPELDGLILAVGLSHRTTLLSAMIGEWVQMALNGQPLPDLAHEVAPDRRETAPSTTKPVPEAPSRRGGPIFIPPL